MIGGHDVRSVIYTFWNFRKRHKTCGALAKKEIWLIDAFSSSMIEIRSWIVVIVKSIGVGTCVLASGTFVTILAR